MKITKESLLKIKSLLSSKEKLGLHIYYDIIEVLRRDPLINNKIKCIKNSGSDIAYTIFKNETIYFTDNVIPFSEIFYKDYSYLPEYDEVAAFNYRLVFTLIHEIAHLKQSDYAKRDKGIVGLLYKKIIFEGDLDEETYKNNPYEYVFEYNADFEALRILRYLFDDNEFLTYLNFIEFIGVLSSYYDEETDSFIAERTFNLLNIDDDSVKKVYNEPLDVLIHHGLPISKKNLNEIYGDEKTIEHFVKVRKKYKL